RRKRRGFIRTPFLERVETMPVLREHSSSSSARKSARRSNSVTLSVIEGPHTGEVYTFSQHDTFLVGRSRKAHFRLPKKDMFFSRIHFLVEANPPQCRIIDMGSHNGTYVNGQRTNRADLRDGDQVRAGHTI